MYRIAQLTDIHIGNTGDDTFEVDVRGHFRRTLAQAVRDGAHELLITGDLAYRSGEPEIYAWIAQELASLQVPWWVLPGNHDDVAMMNQAFGDRVYGEQLYARTVATRRLLFVDSGSGRVDAAQLDALAQELKNVSSTPLLFIHHPPALLGVPYMDEGHALENHVELLEILKGCSQGVNVFCGHYHVERSLRCGNVAVFATPSTFFQLDPRYKSFVVDHRDPGYRMICFDEQQLQTTVHWLV